MRAFPFFLLALTALAIVAGWLATPRYRSPADSGEGRLKERAVEYYKASRRLDYGAMCVLFTPARQMTEADQLRRDIRDKQATYEAMNEATKKNLQFSADSVTAERIVLEIEGDWAVANGSCDIQGDSGPLTIPLPDTVWVRTDGEWWLYSLKNEELNAYGNPPDFARDKFQLRTPLMVGQDRPETQ